MSTEKTEHNEREMNLTAENQETLRARKAMAGGETLDSRREQLWEWDRRTREMGRHILLQMMRISRDDTPCSYQYSCNAHLQNRQKGMAYVSLQGAGFWRMINEARS